jgi:hypothetical protein
MKNLTHNGKIGRLPKSVQEEVNRRLERGEKGPLLLAWLNALPEVQALLAAEFAGKPVRKQNLSEWRHHGYQEWLWRQEALALAQALPPETAALQAADQLAGWVSVRYLLAVRELIEAKAGGKPDLKVLRAFCHDVVALRRGEQRAARLKIEQERRQYVLEKMAAKFQEA